MNVTVRLPPLDELAERWREISPLIAKSTNRAGGAYQPIDVLRAAFQGQFGIWICEVDGEVKATIVTEIKQYPRRRALEMVFAGGSDMNLWITEAIKAIDQHAREMACECITSLGRPGWLRAWGAEATGDIAMLRRVVCLFQSASHEGDDLERGF